MTSFEPRRDPENNERRFLQRYFPRSNGRVLDIGCGDGRLTWLYARRAGFVVGTDIDMAELQVAESSYSGENSAQVFFAASSGEALPFMNKLFDLALFSWSL